MNYTPNTRDQLRIVRNNLEMFGLRQTLRDALAYVLAQRADDFDRRHNVSTRLTSGGVLPLEAGIGDAKAIENGHGYEPTKERVMRHILGFVAGRFDPSTLTFVDLGCGRGRAVLMAAELPFREVIGVELSPEHCDAARRNLVSYRPSRRPWTRLLSRSPLPRRAPVRISQADATKVALPESDLLVYMFNPFRGSVFQAVLDRLAEFQAERRHKVYLVLSNPAMEDMLLAHPAFARTHEFQVIGSGNSWNFWTCDGARANGHAQVAGTQPSA